MSGMPLDEAEDCIKHPFIRIHGVTVEMHGTRVSLDLLASAAIASMIKINHADNHASARSATHTVPPVRAATDPIRTNPDCRCGRRMSDSRPLVPVDVIK